MEEIRLTTQTRTYNIVIQDSEMNQIPRKILSKYPHRKWLIITDENVAEIYLNDFLEMFNERSASVNHYIIPPGENSKALSMAEQIYDFLCVNNYTRNDGIIALGGGVVGDLAGFVASTYLRGIIWVQVPTTLLAQVDSSVGGKVAVNNKYGKNLVGSFYQPHGVFIDTLFLLTLNERELKSGLAEVIKYACIEDAVLFSELEEGDITSINWSSVIKKCILIKKQVIEKDEKELNERKHLNFGHTLGHGIEKYFDYKTYNHGEAVALGMWFGAWLSFDLSLLSKASYLRIKNLLEQYDYIKKDEYDTDRLFQMILQDKKRQGDYIEYILLDEIGESRIYKLAMVDLKDKLDKGLK